MSDYWWGLLTIPLGVLALGLALAVIYGLIMLGWWASSRLYLGRGYSWLPRWRDMRTEAGGEDEFLNWTARVAALIATGDRPRIKSTPFGLHIKASGMRRSQRTDRSQDALEGRLKLGLVRSLHEWKEVTDDHA